MEKAVDFLQNATQCRALASGAASRDQRDHLLALAQAWDWLADERQRLQGGGAPSIGSRAPSTQH